MIYLTYDGIVIGIISMAMATLGTLVRSATIDREKLKDQKAKIKEHQTRIKEAQKKKDYKAMQAGQKQLSEVMMEQMRHSFKPMLYTMIPFLLVFSWLRTTYDGSGNVVLFSFILPVIGWDGLGWLGWYILSSMVVSIILNKALKLT